MSKEADNKEVGSDLCKLAIILHTHRLCQDISPIQTAGNSCISNASAATWAYSLNKVVFPVDDVGGRLSNDTTSITVSLTIDIEGRVVETKEVYNPLSKLLFDLEIDGWKPNEKANDIDPVYAAWHLDRHIFGPNDGKTKYSHPLYHFTFGGTKMEEKGHDIYGSTIIMPSPRLLYPPMDAVLGIDFIVQNYLHKDTIQNLVTDPEYIQIVKRSQDRIWKPFFCSIYSHWNQGAYQTETDFSALKLFPLYY